MKDLKYMNGNKIKDTNILILVYINTIKMLNKQYIFLKFSFM